MSADQERLVVALEARIRDFERNMQRANQTAHRQFGAIERRANETAGRLERAFRNSGSRIAMAFSRLGATFAAGFTLRGAQQLIDAATKIENQLKAAGLEGDALSAVYARLFKSAQKNAAPIGALADLYSKISITQKELNVSTEELLSFTDNVAVALRVAGTDAQTASGSLLQLSQALGGGVVRAEEFNSILEGTPAIARTVAVGLKEAGGSVAELRKLVVDGKVSSEAFFRAFQAGSVVLQQQAETSQITIGQAFTRLGNSLIHIAGEFDKATGTSAKFADGITNLADAISNFDVSGFVGKINDALEAVERFFDTLGNAQVFKDFNAAMGITDADGNVINLDAKAAKDDAAALEREIELLQATIEKNTELGFDNKKALARLEDVKARLAEVLATMKTIPATLPNPSSAIAEIDRRVAARDKRDSEVPAVVRTSGKPPAVQPVSIADYAVPGDKSKKGGRGSGGGGRTNAYEREIADIERRVTILRAETEARREAGGSLENQARAADRAKMVAELLNAAQNAGVTVTDGVRSRIDGLADAYAAAALEAENLARSQEEAAQMAEELASLAGSAISGVVKDLIAGKDPAEAFANMLAGIADKLIELAIRAMIVKPLLAAFGFSDGGLVGGGNGFASVGCTGDGGKYEPAGLVHRGEYVISKEATHRIGVKNLEALHRGALHGFSSGGMVGEDAPRNVSRMLHGANDNAPFQQISINAPITVNGCSAGTAEQNEDLARRMRRETEAVMRSVVADEIRRSSRPGNVASRMSR